jgi:hypothetical protein
MRLIVSTLCGGSAAVLRKQLAAPAPRSLRPARAAASGTAPPYRTAHHRESAGQYLQAFFADPASCVGQCLRSRMDARPGAADRQWKRGWAMTGAITHGSSVIVRAKFPVTHIPTAPTPRPPISSKAWRASARSQSTIGLERFSASTWNSRLTQSFASWTPALTYRISPVRDSLPGRERGGPVSWISGAFLA